MSDQSEAHQINNVLKTRYGCNTAGQQIFRLSWSDAQTELRFGVYNEWYGDIFIRQTSGLKEVPKYPYAKDCWVLERWMPPALAYTDEIPATAQGSFEPIFVFRAEDGSKLPLNEEVIHKLIWHLFHPQLPGDRLSDMKAQERKEFEDEVKQNVEELSEMGRTWIGHRLHSGEAIVKPEPQVSNLVKL